MAGSPTCVVLLHRRLFYAALVLWSSLLITFTAIRLAYTIQLRNHCSVCNGKSFYDPPVVELGLCGLLALVFCVLMLFVLATRTHRPVISRNWFELTCIVILCMLWLGGAAASSAIWFDLNTCIEYNECRVSQAILAFAWLGWITITFQSGTAMCVLLRTGDWGGHVFEQPKGPTTVEEGGGPMEPNASPEANADVATPPSYREGQSQTTESYRLSSFSDVVPYWLAWSNARISPRSSVAPTDRPNSNQQSPQTRRKSSLVTHATFHDQGSAYNQPSTSLSA